MTLLGPISAKEHSAIQLLAALAQTFKTRQPLSLSEISEQEHISAKYLEQLAAPFCRAGWLQSRRGRHGGYIMVADPKTISFKEIVLLLGGSPVMVACLNKDRGSCCAVEQTCQSRKGWLKIQQSLEQALAEVTIADVVSH